MTDRDTHMCVCTVSVSPWHLEPSGLTLDDGVHLVFEVDTYAHQVGPRRRHSAGFRAQDLAECEAPDASVAAVAQSHGLNANLVHK